MKNERENKHFLFWWFFLIDFFKVFYSKTLSEWNFLSFVSPHPPTPPVPRPQYFFASFSFKDELLNYCIGDFNFSNTTPRLWRWKRWLRQWVERSKHTHTPPPPPTHTHIHTQRTRSAYSYIFGLQACLKRFVIHSLNSERKLTREKAFFITDWSALGSICLQVIFYIPHPTAFFSSQTR